MEIEEIKIAFKCPFWPICGAGIVRYLNRENYIKRFCSNEKDYPTCPHYQIRAVGPLAKSKEVQNLIKES